MIHYNVWFSFKEGTPEADGLVRVTRFLDDLKQRGLIYDFTLLRNRATADKTRLDRFQALISFTDQEQFGAPFREVAATGIHAGGHGFMIENVGNFVVEVFDEMPSAQHGAVQSASRSAMRRFYARHVAALAGITDLRTIEAFEAVRREDFVGPGPWSVPVGDGRYIETETDDPAVLYQDILIGLARDRGINNGEPSLHAKNIGAAAPQDGDVVVHVGAGAGYYTAILAWLAGASGRVHAYEIEPDVAVRAADNLAALPTVTVHAQSVFDAQLPSANVIYVSAGATHVPAQWLDALALGGRLVMPLTPNNRLGCMLLVTRHSDAAFGAKIFSPAGFIPCIGARDDEESQALATALDTRSTEDVHALRRGGAPDKTAWCVGKDWWLSTAEPAVTEST